MIWAWSDRHAATVSPVRIATVLFRRGSGVWTVEERPAEGAAAILI
ncbi:hypothetical protein HDG33_003786 [Paraburkholderia sp. Cpub6]|nr:hypothetical protein [Paraburkholderia sp. Cpub6]